MARLYFEFYKISDNLDFVNVNDADVVASFSTNKIFEGDLQNISIKRNINNIIQSATISNLPFEEIYRYIAKYDRIFVYYQFLNVVTGREETVTLFDGEIANKSSAYAMEGGHSITLELFSKTNILSRISNPAQSKGESLQQYVRNSLEESGLTNVIGLNFQMDKDFFGRFNPSGKLINELKEIREKYAVFVYENEDGELVIATPYFLRNNLTTVEKYDIDVKSYPIEVFANNLYSDINCVIALGFNTKEDKVLTFGIAFDPFNFRINGKKLNYRIEYAFDLTGGKPALSSFALNKLLEESKQYRIELKNIPFETRFKLGKLITIKNHPEINPTQLFMIEEIEENLSIEDSRVDLVVSGFALGVIPEDILNGNEKAFGALNPDVNVQLKTLRK